jgi:hypothetical protein
MSVLWIWQYDFVDKRGSSLASGRWIPKAEAKVLLNDIATVVLQEMVATFRVSV